MTVENTIIGTMLIEPSLIDIITGLINKDMIYDDKNKSIFKAIIDLKSKSKNIDLILVSDYLRKNNQLDWIGISYLSSLTSHVPSNIANSIENYCRILVEDYIRRQMFIIYNQSINELQDKQNDVFEILNSGKQKLEKLFDVNSIEFKTVGKIMSDRISEIEKHIPGQLLGITTGHPKLDELTSGFQASDFILVGGRPSMGKTAISLVMAKSHLLQSDDYGLYFSLEMSKERLAERLLSYETTISTKTIQKNLLNQSEQIIICEVIDKYSKVNLIILDESGMTVERITSISTILCRKYKIKFIMIDYIQMMAYSLKDNKNDNQQISHISKGLKNLAKKLQIPIIGLSQLNRNCELRANKRPVLSDLRDSGSLEQDADIIIFIYRDEFYFPETLEKNIIEMIIAKHRNGGIGTILWYINETWSYLSDRPYNEYLSENIPNF